MPDRHVDSTALVNECQAFLDGGIVEQFIRSEIEIPAWAWINLLAHGEESQLSNPPMPRHDRRGEDVTRWCDARAYLAHEVLRRARHVGSLRAVQRRVIVPLELMLAAEPSVCTWLPSQLVRTTLAALDVGARRGWS
jgi:hypothetical protein